MNQILNSQTGKTITAFTSAVFNTEMDFKARAIWGTHRAKIVSRAEEKA
jgi:hypothetical protein